MNKFLKPAFEQFLATMRYRTQFLKTQPIPFKSHLCTTLMKSKGLLSLLLLTICFSAYSQNVNIPDVSFKNFLVTNYDKDGDGEIHTAEAEAVSLFPINASALGITDATGIEAFVNVTSLDLSGNNLTTINVSSNTKLTSLLLNDNNINAIDLSSNQRLTTLNMDNNSLTSIDLTSNQSLETLLLEGNELASLDLSNQSGSLITLSIGNNPGTTSFNISGLSELGGLIINSSSLTSLDVSANTKLTQLTATGNPGLTCVTVADPTYPYASLASLDNPVVFTDNCSNPLVVIPDTNMKNALLSHSPVIDMNSDSEIRADEAAAFTGTLSLAGLNIEDATGIEAFTNATSIDLSDNSLFRLNLDANTSLTSVLLFENDLHYFSIKNGNNTAITSLDVSDNSNLECMSVDDLIHANSIWVFPLGTAISTDCDLFFADANFKAALLAHSPVIDLNADDEISLSEAEAMTGTMNIANKNIADLSGIEAFSNIAVLSASGNDLTTIDLTRNKTLSQVLVPQNNLTALGLGDKPAMTTLWVFDNLLTSLDVSGYAALTSLHCSDNNLASLSVPSQLTYLVFGGNPVSTSFDYTGLTELQTLSFSGTEIPIPDVSALVDLGAFFCTSCGIDEIDLSNNIKLNSLSMSNNNLESIDLTQNVLLTSLFLRNNDLASLDISMLPDLANVNLDENMLTSLNANNGTIIGILRAPLNPNLSCISVANPDFAPFYTFENSGVAYFENCGSLPIDFIDANFEQALVNHAPVIDTNANGIIEIDEAASFTGAIDVSNESIAKVNGLVYFENASSIDLSNNNIKRLSDSIGGISATSIDLSNNQLSLVRLTGVNTSSLTDLIIDNNPNLTCINVDDLAYANANWTVSPDTMELSTDCNLYIPDPLFKADLIADINIDMNDDDEIQLSEAEAFSGTISTPNTPIADLTGIEAFINLNWLDVGNSNLIDADLSENINLTTVIIDGGGDLETINLSGNTKLTRLELNNNDLTELDLSTNVMLDRVNIRSNTNISHLDLSANSVLTSVDVRFSGLESLNIKNGNNRFLNFIDIRNTTNLTCIDVDIPAYFHADSLAFNTDGATTFDTNCGDPLVDISDANFLAALIGHSPSFDINMDGDIRVSEVSSFSGTLDVSNSSITSLSGIEAFTNLTGLIANNNQIVDLDVSDNNLLTILNASNNVLESLDVRNGNNENFTSFDATGNALLTCIDVDDVAYATANWTDIDLGSSFARFCDPNGEVYIPDSNLRSALNASDDNADGTITFAEAGAFVGDINITSSTESLEGLQYFTNINSVRYLNSDNDNIQSFDFSGNIGLKELFISTTDGALATVDINENINLTELTLVNVDLTTIDFTLYPELEEIFLIEFGLGTIDLSANTQLQELRLREMGLTSLDLSTNTLLEELNIDGNPLTSLDLTNNIAITDLNISQTGITTIDVSHLTELSDFRVEAGSLTSLDVSQNNKLSILYAAGDPTETETAPVEFGTLTEVLLPSTSTLNDVDLTGNRIDSIDISGLNHNSLRVFLEYNDLKDVSISSIGGSNANINLSHNALTSINATQVTGASAQVRVDDNLLVEASVGSVAYVGLRNNPNLTCAFAFDPANAFATYDYDTGLSFSNVSCNITWEGVSGWSNTTGPTASDDVLILQDYDFATHGVFECNDLQVNGFATLTVNNQGTLQVNGEFRNNGRTIVESGASLITFAANDFIDEPVEFRRNTRYGDGRYSFVGTPVEQIDSIIGSDLGTYVYKYNETIPYAADGINRWELASMDELIPGKGYTQAFQQEITFTGIPNTGAITYMGTYTEDIDDANEGWNLIANPYPAAIDVSTFLSVNANILGAVYIWNDNGSDTERGTNADYIVANAIMATNSTPAGGENRYNQHLGSSQGFFVKLLDNINTDIVFTESMRVSGNNSDNNFFRKVTLPIVRINLEDDKGLFRQAVIGFTASANVNDLNPKYDAGALDPLSDFGLYTLKAEQSLVLNGVIDDWDRIQLQLNTKEAGEYRISAVLEGYENAIFLKDNYTDRVTDLTKGGYSFATQSGIDMDRFELMASPQSLLEVDKENSEVLVYAAKGILYVQQLDDDVRTYHLFNINGDRLLSMDFKTSGKLDLSTYSKGVYLVFDGDKTHKIILD